MTPIEAVHTFARHCCLNRRAALKQEYDQTKAAGANKDVTYGCRSNVLQAILVEVERLTYADFRSRGHAAARLLEAGQFAQNQFTAQKSWQQAPYLPAMQAERDLFADSLRQFVAQKDWKHWRVEPLPYRRTLLPEESQRLMATLRARWGITGTWWVPFEKYDLPYELIVLDSRAVRDQLGYAALQQILARRDIPRVYELWEFGREPDREMELSLWKPTSAWPERYWCTDELDWLLYATHENSTTIAGDWLLREIKAAWPDWQAYTWIAPWPNPSWAG